MTKKIALINDLSGFGRCSLTAAISTIAAMGVQPCPLPTAILSAQTGYPTYFCDDYTDKMERFRQEWEKLRVVFDGIYTGFVASEAQIHHIFQFLDTFQTPGTFLLVDPVLGDNGKPYAMFTPTLCSLMKELVQKADYITPNLTEFCLLTDTDYKTFENCTEPEHLINQIYRQALVLMEHGPNNIIVTGIEFSDSKTGEPQMGNLYLTQKGCQMISFPYVGESYSGTGDLFASILAGGIARGDDALSLISLAGKFIQQGISDSAKEHIPRNDGINYEQYLWMLTQKGDSTS